MRNYPTSGSSAMFPLYAGENWTGVQQSGLGVQGLFSFHLQRLSYPLPSYPDPPTTPSLTLPYSAMFTKGCGSHNLLHPPPSPPLFIRIISSTLPHSPNNPLSLSLSLTPSLPHLSLPPVQATATRPPSSPKGCGMHTLLHAPLSVIIRINQLFHLTPLLKQPPLSLSLSLTPSLPLFSLPPFRQRLPGHHPDLRGKLPGCYGLQQGPQRRLCGLRGYRH